MRRPHPALPAWGLESGATGYLLSDLVSDLVLSLELEPLALGLDEPLVLGLALPVLPLGVALEPDAALPELLPELAPPLALSFFAESDDIEPDAEPLADGDEGEVALEELDDGDDGVVAPEDEDAEPDGELVLPDGAVVAPRLAPALSARSHAVTRTVPRASETAAAIAENLI